MLPWYYNLQFFSNAGLLDFVNESSANLAAKSVSLDLLIATVLEFRLSRSKSALAQRPANVHTPTAT
ncbi:DUF2834 domain-containing protein, partial [Microcoleus sp. S28C3]|uniref:DUF2834 domain-containing protein n=1 Tax=Microcoleus sp. S28C3 TaxID=3055414 RepID=UPI002FD17732